MLRSNAPYLFCLLLLFACGHKLSETETHVDAVEHSLRPPITLTGDHGWSIEERMGHYGVPGASIAVVYDGKIAWSRQYGVVDRVSELPVDAGTLFQAASISKPVTAMAIMRMQQDGVLQLDSNVNDYLTEWQLEVNNFNETVPVTPRHLLSHTGGISVHGFPGYEPTEVIPNLLEILDSDGSANTWVVRPVRAPGEYMYSGGGYCILQQLLIEQEARSFPDLMQDRVLDPLEMNQSTFMQPLDSNRMEKAASGYLPDGKIVQGRRHVYPEMAAAGLWTTASDLAKFGIDLQGSYQGASNKVLQPETAQEMLRPVFENSVAHGIFLEEYGDEVYFGHGGWNAGFSSQLVMNRDRDYGVVVMLNSNHPQFINELIRSVALVYQWADYPVESYESLPIDQAELNRICGRYKYSSDKVREIYVKGDSLFLQDLESEPMQLFRTADNCYVRRERRGLIKFVKSDGHQYLVYQSDSQDSVRFDHPKLAHDEKVPFEFILDSDFRNARKSYLKLEKAKPRNPDLMTHRFIQRANLLLDRDEVDKAVALLEIGTELHPGSYTIFHELAEAYLKDGDQERALRNFRKSLKFYPQNEEAKTMIEKLENPLVEI